MNIQILRTQAARRLLAISAMALMGGSALAQVAGDEPPPPPPGAQAEPGGPRGEPPRFDPKRQAEQQAQRLDVLKAKLAITPQQEAAWKAWTEAGKPPQRPAAPPDAKAEREDFAKLTTPERIDRLHALKAQRDLEQTQRDNATKAFYASLTPAQQKVFDAETLPPPPGPRGGPHGPHGKDGKGGEPPAPRPGKPADDQ
ncbi:MAG: Spy/CpxP family protein refolding chaperone [Comamonas sp.]